MWLVAVQGGSMIVGSGLTSLIQGPNLYANQTGKETKTRYQGRSWREPVLQASIKFDWT